MTSFMLYLLLIVELDILIIEENHFWCVEHENIRVHFLNHATPTLWRVSDSHEILIEVVEHEIANFITDKRIIIKCMKLIQSKRERERSLSLNEIEITASCLGSRRCSHHWYSSDTRWVFSLPLVLYLLFIARTLPRNPCMYPRLITAVLSFLSACTLHFLWLQSWCTEANCFIFNNTIHHFKYSYLCIHSCYYYISKECLLQVKRSMHDLKNRKSLNHSEFLSDFLLMLEILLKIVHHFRNCSIDPSDFYRELRWTSATFSKPHLQSSIQRTSNQIE